MPKTIMNKKNLNILFGIPKHTSLPSKILHVVTRQGTNTSNNNVHTMKPHNKDIGYP